MPGRCLCGAWFQVQRRLSQPQHGREASGTNTAGLQTAAVQSGKIRREGENGARHGQTAPGTANFISGWRCACARAGPLQRSLCQHRGSGVMCSYMLRVL